MSLAELLPAARALDTCDKLRLIQALTEDVARDDPPALIPTGVELPVWSPYESHDAAAVLERMLREDQSSRGDRAGVASDSTRAGPLL